MHFDSSAALIRLDEAWRRAWAPPPRLSISEWADKYRQLSREASAEPGQWVTARAEYQRGMMDAILDPNTLGVVIMTSSQVGKSEILLNTLGYFAHMEPAPILLIQPTLEVAEAFSKDRVAPLIRDSEVLTPLFEDKERHAANSIKHKTFPGGHITFAGANSPSSLSSRPIRVLLCDEVDRYPVSAGKEGDPLLLAFKRTRAYWNRVRVQVSTPTVRGASRIESDFERSTQERFHVPCPYCEHKQVLIWAQVKWNSEPAHDPASAYYECRSCSKHWTEGDRLRAVAHGEWVADNPDAKTRGFHIWEAYSPWSTLESIVTDFLAAKGDKEQLQVWTNTTLGESWEDMIEEREPAEIWRTRRSSYGPEVPERAMLVVGGIDVQKDRVELETVAVAPTFETWQMSYDVVHGSPEVDTTWDAVDNLLLRQWEHTSGVMLPYTAVGVDSGNWADEVYSFCKPRLQRRVWAVKGRGGEGLPAIVSSTVKNRQRCRVFTLGVDGLKRQFYSALYEVEEPGPRFCHYPMNTELRYFENLMSEHPEYVWRAGRRTVRWVARKSMQQEPLDTRVYALGALAILAPAWPQIQEKFIARVARQKPQPEETVETPTRRTPVRGVTVRQRRKQNRTTEW